MVDKKSGVASQILAIQSKSLLTHCFGHSLSLAVKDLTSHCKIIGDVMRRVGKRTVIVKFLPKREKMLDSLIEGVEGVEENETVNNKADSLDKLCATRWTVRARCFQKIITHDSSIQQLWEKCLAETLTREEHSRIVGCQGQMVIFDTYFGLCLGQTLGNLTDNLSKYLQSESFFCC